MSHNLIRKYLKNKIINNKKFVGHDKERTQIHDLFQRTIEHGESNSLLIIGPRGAGKTTLVNDVLNEIQTTEDFKANCLLVKLHGLIHTDDRLALKSATSQMDLDNAVDGKVFGSFADNLQFLLACLRTGQKETSKSVIFILEEFDLFCSHHNQTLLYNLFDICQSAQSPICVLGLTSRLDVIQLLEKRVKSRFSHRQIFMFSGPEENSDLSHLDYVLSRIEQYLSIDSDAPSKITLKSRKQWNTSIKSLINDKKFKNIIQRIVDLDTNENTLKRILVNIVFNLSEKDEEIVVKDLDEQLNLLEKDEAVQVLQDLSILELCLVIAMKHHNSIYDNQPMNFEMILTRYMKFAHKHCGIQVVRRSVLLKAFEHIEYLELISNISATGSKVQKEYQFFKLLVTPEQISEAIKKSPGLPTEVIQWSNSSLA